MHFDLFRRGPPRLQKTFYQERLKNVSNFSHSPARRDEQEYLYEDDDDDGEEEEDDDYPNDGVELAHGDLLGSLHCGHHLLLVLKFCHHVIMLVLKHHQAIM